MASTFKASFSATASGAKASKAAVPPRYRRSTITRAPRKRTFIANMEKYVIQSAVPLGDSLVAHGISDDYSILCADGGNNGFIGGSNGMGGNNNNNNNGGNNSSDGFGASGEGNQDGITAICVVLGLSLVAMLQRIPMNADALTIKANNGAWASITLCSN